MTGSSLDKVLRHVRTLATPGDDWSDRALLDRYLAHRDEAAFAALVERHSPMVHDVCRRVLRHAEDAEDACQATFLVLARRAASMRKREALGSWLHGVALRVASKLRADLARRRAREYRAVGTAQWDGLAEASWREVQAVLDNELNRLPDHYRAPLVLCYLEGKTQDEAARQLGWSPGTFRGRLDRGRARLAARLVRRGVTLSAALFGAALAPSLVTARAASDLIPPRVAVLVEGVLRSMKCTRLKLVTIVLLAMGTLVSGAGLLAHRALATGPGTDAPADKPAVETRPDEPPLEKPGAWVLDFKFKGPRLITVDVPGRGRNVCWYL